MRVLHPTVVVAVCAVLGCARTGAPAPTPSRSANDATRPENAAPSSAAAGDSIIHRVLYSTTTSVQGGAPGRIVGPRARMVPAVVPPRVLLSDSTFSVFVMVGADGKAKLETLKLHDGATEAQRAATREWLAAASFTPPQRDGAPVEAPYEVRGRAAARALMSGGDMPPAGAVVGAVGGSSTAARALMPRRPGELSGAQMLAIVPRVARIVSDLDTLRVRPGTPAVFASTLQIGVLDSAGAFLGYLPRYDSSIRAEIMELDGRSVTANAEGVVSLRLSWPRSMWQGRTDSAPALSLPVLSSRRVTDQQLAAQGLTVGGGTGQCATGSRDIDCSYIASRFGEGSRDAEVVTRIRTLVLQRGLPTEMRVSRTADTSTPREQMRRMRSAQNDATERGRMFFGRVDPERGPLGYELNQFHLDTVFVGSRVFTAPWRRDSALVILLDHSRSGSPVVGTMMIPSAVPEGVTTKHWQSGDTLFTVMPSDPDSKWRAFFARFPAIAEFLK